VRRTSRWKVGHAAGRPLIAPHNGGQRPITETTADRQPSRAADDPHQPPNHPNTNTPLRLPPQPSSLPPLSILITGKSPLQSQPPQCHHPTLSSPTARPPSLATNISTSSTNPSKSPIEPYSTVAIRLAVFSSTGAGRCCLRRGMWIR